jgi:outer membrane protein assembly factor BamB
MQDYRLNITKPDGTTETRGPFTPDPTETIYTTYAADQIGNYSVVLWYPNTVYIWNDTSAIQTWTNDTFLGATSKPATFTVQNEPVPEAIGSYPLPADYWTYPIEAQNTNWYTVASNWLGTGSPQIGGTNFQQAGIAPNSAHIMWTKPIQDGGIAGGNNVGTPGQQFYTGQSYNQRFPNPIIMTGRLFYREPAGETAQSGDTVCVDLKTGQELWRRSDLPALSFGYTYDLETPNQEGVWGNGILFSSNFAQAFDPRNGNSLFNVTSVPSGTQAYGPQGEILRYVFTNTGTTANQNYTLSQWNSSRLWDNSGTTPTIPTSVSASTGARYDWNASVPWRNGMTGTIVVLDAFLGDVMIGINGTTGIGDPGYTLWGGWNNGTANPYTIWAVSLKPQTQGQLLWMKTYTTPEGTDTSVLVWPETVDPTTRVFNIYIKETMDLYGYNLDTGEQKWGPLPDQFAFDTFTGSVNTENTGAHRVAYGNLYFSGYGGVLRAINQATGQLEWKYGNGGVGNSTAVPIGTPWAYLPTFIGGIADGKIYLFNDEHSPTTPLYKGALIRCVNATTGQEIWTLSGWGDGGGFVAQNGAIAAGEYVYLNMYDMQINAIGKGPSATTLEAPIADIAQKSGLVLRGTVMDISAGTKQNQQAADFPNGVPAVSDASQSDWMPYVYMQKPKPTNTTGVSVTIDVVDANGNFRNIGKTTTDSSGAFSLQWTPDISGKYIVMATFVGSESYWPSNAETSFAVDPASPTLAPTSTPTTSIADMYFVPAIAGLFLAIIVVGAVLAILLLRKRP